MNKFVVTLIATALGFGLTSATAQNVDSDKAKAQGQDKVMQDKEQGAAAQGNTSDTDRERTNRHVDQGSARGQTGQAQPSAQTDGSSQKQGSPDNSGQNKPGQDQSNGQQIPAQSNSSVGKPQEQKPKRTADALRAD